MKTPNLTWRELAERVPSLMPTESLHQQLQALHAQEEKPWIVTFFSGVGAWFSALFLLPFLAMTGAFNSVPGSAVVGLMLLGAAIAVSRSSPHVFPSQLALSLLLAGHAMIHAGVAMSLDSEKLFFESLTITQVILAAVTCILFRGITGRFLSLVAVPACAATWLIVLQQPHGLHGIIAFLAVATGFLWTWKGRPDVLDVVAWAAILSLPCVVLLIELLHGITWWQMSSTPLWPSSLMLGAILLWLVADQHGGLAVWSRPWFMGFAVVVVIIAALGAVGVLVAMLLLYMARSRDEPGLSVIGHLFLTGFLVLFYYALNISLAEKSLLVTGSGVLFLLLRQMLGRSETLSSSTEAVS